MPNWGLALHRLDPTCDRVRDRRRAPSWLLFAFGAISLAAHAGVLGALSARQSSPDLQFRPSTQPLAGETLDVDPAPLPDEDVAEEAEPTAARQAVAAVPGPAVRKAARGAHVDRPADRPADANASPGGAPAPALYGAVGVRFATDLATTFTRAFPQAASADPIWSTSSIGSAGTADVTLLLDEEGHIAGSRIEGAPSPALRRGIDRTLALLSPRTFTAMRPATRLRVTARVARDEVHDGLHGDVFALSGGSFSGDTGTAFFALPASGGGRRIDVELRLLP